MKASFLFIILHSAFLATTISTKHVETNYFKYTLGNGKTRAVDLNGEVDQPLLDSLRRDDINRYNLFTRQNKRNGQTLKTNDTEALSKSNFNADNPVLVVVHGWLQGGFADLNPTITEAALTKRDVNVIVVDWRRLALSNYLTATNGVPDVGRYLGRFLAFVHSSSGAPYNKMHLAGFSLGAHVVGNAGRELGGDVQRVTGLDPAGPLWGVNRNRLAKEDGVYVEAIHTDGANTGLGTSSRLGDADFYPNGGSSQPGCATNVCNHNRSWELFASSLVNDNFKGKECSNMVQVNANTCRGKELKMGNDDLNKSGSGIYRLDTGRRYPY